jgi:hypothetical protein
MTPERIAAMEAAAAKDAEDVLESMLAPAAPLDEDVSPVAGRRFSRT